MAKAPSLRKDWTRGTQRTRKLSTGKVLWSWRNGKERFVRARRETAGAKPYTMKVVRTVFNGGCDMKSSQSLLCTTLCPDTTRCPISGILRRCAGRQQLVQSLRTMNPQSSDWHHTREGMMYLSAPRRRRG